MFFSHPAFGLAHNFSLSIIVVFLQAYSSWRANATGFDLNGLNTAYELSLTELSSGFLVDQNVR